jgi:hypothetical protein
MRINFQVDGAVDDSSQHVRGRIVVGLHTGSPYPVANIRTVLTLDSSLNATFTGDVNAVTGDFSGNVEATDGDFAGTVAAPTGTFTESLTVSGTPVASGTSIYEGPDGIQYAWDSTREKYLSTARSILQYGRNATLHAGALSLSPGGGVAPSFGLSANMMPRNATITSVVLQGATVSGSVFFRLREQSDGGSTTDIKDFILEGPRLPDPASNSISTISGGLNIDIPAGSGIEAILPGAPPEGYQITDPLCNVEIAWRDS